MELPPNVQILEHPVIQAKLTKLRDKNTPASVFRQETRLISALMVYPLTQTLAIESKQVQTPLETVNGVTLSHDLILIPILRAGLGMLDGMVDLLERVKVGFVGVYRDHTTHQPVEYYTSLPQNLSDLTVLVIDPMLATGGSAIHAIDIVKRHHGTDITFASMISAPEGIIALSRAHPDVTIVTCAIDRQLNADKYILPGLGDAGDRIYDT